jgi:TonB family protein
MIPKKVIILSLAISLISHILILSVTGFIPAYVERATDQTMMVELTGNPLKSDEQKSAEAKIPPMHLKIRETKATSEKEEDTVELDDTESRYALYLMRVKQRIESVWSYPGDALNQKVTGSNVIRFTIDHSGSLAGIHLLNRSGSDELDRGSLRAIRSASPFDPFPANLDLFRLHIIATFDYRIAD